MWAIEMSTVEMKERERHINTVVLCGGLGLLMAIAVATVLVYEESPAERLQPARISNDREQLQAEEKTTDPRGKWGDRMLNISRVDAEASRTPGWRVTVQRRHRAYSRCSLISGMEEVPRPWPRHACFERRFSRDILR